MIDSLYGIQNSSLQKKGYFIIIFKDSLGDKCYKVAQRRLGVDTKDYLQMAYYLKDAIMIRLFFDMD